MIEAEISRFTGLLLVEVVEITAILGVAIGLITAFGLGIQIRRQRKVNSARFTVDYIDKILVDNQKAIRVLNTRQSNKEEKFENDSNIESLLNGLDNVCQFINDGVIDKNQALNTLRITLRRLKNDDEVKRIIKEKRNTEKEAFDKVTDFWDKEIV